MIRQYLNRTVINLFILFAIMLSTGCATEDPLLVAERLAARQTSLIRQHLPINSGAYSWVRAENKGAIIHITLLGKEELKPDGFAQNFPQKMCEQPAVTTLLDKGVSYQIMINYQGNAREQFVLDIDTCGSVHS